MKKMIGGLVAATLAGTMAVASVAPASAQSISFSFGQRDQVIDRYCDYHPRDRDCRRFYDGDWDRGDYHSFYRSNRSGLDSIAAGLFGFTFGTIIGGVIANSNDRVVLGYDDWEDHVDACYDRYRSYDERTDTFLGYDGYRHRCRL